MPMSRASTKAAYSHQEKYKAFMQSRKMSNSAAASLDLYPSHSKQRQEQFATARHCERPGGVGRLDSKLNKTAKICVHMYHDRIHDLKIRPEELAASRHWPETARFHLSFNKE